MSEKIRATTILCVRKNGSVAMASDGQVTLGQTVVKATAKKLRKMADGGVLGGFAGGAADGIALFERLENKLKENNQQLLRAAVELAKDWRTDRAMRRLEAMLLVADRERTLILSGSGDIIEPEGGVAAIGSGGPLALSAARALCEATQLSPRQITERAMRIAGELCIYTNTELCIEELS